MEVHSSSFTSSIGEKFDRASHQVHLTDSAIMREQQDGILITLSYVFESALWLDGVHHVLILKLSVTCQ